MFFSWTLHAIVYFWLMPTYIAYYTILPRAIGGRLYSDAMGRIAFILFVVVAMPIGVHHLFADPQVGAGFKFMHSVFTGAGRAADAADGVHDLRLGRDRRPPARRHGRVRLGDGAAVAEPDHAGDRACRCVMLGFGGAGGLINMSYQLDASVHNTQWITGHFHLIFGGAIVIMYFAIAYDLWPHLTGRRAGELRPDAGPALAVVHRHDRARRSRGTMSASSACRAAWRSTTTPIRRSPPQALSVTMSAIGGFILLISGILFLIVLVARPDGSGDARRAPTASASPLHMPRADAGRAQQLRAVARR